MTIMANDLELKAACPDAEAEAAAAAAAANDANEAVPAKKPTTGASSSSFAEGVVGGVEGELTDVSFLETDGEMDGETGHMRGVDEEKNGKETLIVDADGHMRGMDD